MCTDPVKSLTFFDRISSGIILSERIIPELILSKKVNGFTGSLHITNLFDTKYELIQDFPMPGQAWQFNLTKTL